VVSGLVVKNSTKYSKLISPESCFVDEGYEKIAIFNQCFTFLGNDTRYRHSYSGRRVWTLMQSIKLHHFQWPWVTPNLDSKVMSHDIPQRHITKIELYLQQKVPVVYDLLYSTIFSDREWPLTQIWRMCDYSTFGSVSHKLCNIEI